ncbi:MAG: hypothetical protein AAF490_26220 [Chloroflexota bacterium]
MINKERNKIAHTDIELMRLRLKLSPGQRIQAMLDARSLMIGIIRGRLRKQFPEITNVELNLKLLEEIKRAKSIPAWSQSIS